MRRQGDRDISIASILIAIMTMAPTITSHSAMQIELMQIAIRERERERESWFAASTIIYNRRLEVHTCHFRAKLFAPSQ